MTIERMLELIILTSIVTKRKDDLVYKEFITVCDKTVNSEAIIDRLYELQSEFIQPYVIENIPKGN